LVVALAHKICIEPLRLSNTKRASYGNSALVTQEANEEAGRLLAF